MDKISPSQSSRQTSRKSSLQTKIRSAQRWLHQRASNDSKKLSLTLPIFTEIARNSPSDFVKLVEFSKDLRLRKQIFNQVIQALCKENPISAFDLVGSRLISDLYLDDKTISTLASALVLQRNSIDIPLFLEKLSKELVNEIGGEVSLIVLDSMQRQDRRGDLPTDYLTGVADFDQNVIENALRLGFGPDSEKSFLNWVSATSPELSRLVSVHFGRTHPDDAKKIIQSNKGSISPEVYRAVSTGAARSHPKEIYNIVDNNNHEVKRQVFQVWLETDSLSATSWVNESQDIPEDEYTTRCIQVAKWLREDGDLSGARLWEGYARTAESR